MRHVRIQVWLELKLCQKPPVLVPFVLYTILFRAKKDCPIYTEKCLTKAGKGKMCYCDVLLLAADCYQQLQDNHVLSILESALLSKAGTRQMSDRDFLCEKTLLKEDFNCL